MARRWEVEGRNGYHAVDEYEGTRCTRTVLSNVSQTVASMVAGELSNAYNRGWTDAMDQQNPPEAREGAQQ